MTQQSTWASPIDHEVQNWHWLLYRAGIDYREDAMSEALESLNDVTRQISKEYAVPLYDLVKLMPKSSEFFYDDVHFNVKGSRTAANELAKYIFQKSLIP
jgi:lysophospholipase L1-like esterase